MRVGALAAMVLVLLGTLSARAAECTLTKVAVLPLESFNGEHPIVTVLLNGAPRNFLVDTGGIFTGVTPEAAQELGLTRRSLDPRREIYTATGALITTYTRVDTMTVGAVTEKSFDLMIWPPGALPGLDGTLGPDFLSKFDLEFDFAAATLNLISPDHCPGNVVYWANAYAEVPFRLSVGNHIVLPATLDGKRITSALDTGAARTFLLRPSARRLFRLKTSSPGMQRVDLPTIENGAENVPAPPMLELFRYPFRELAFEGVLVRHPRILILPDEVGKTFRMRHSEKTQFIAKSRVELERQDVILGMNVLSRLHLYISYKEKKVYLTAADARR